MKIRRKAVAFLDDGGRQATLFDPFAAALRRRGLRTARLTLGRPSLARIIRDSLFYSLVVYLRPDRPEQALRALFARYEIVDIQLGEATLADLGLFSAVTLALAARALSCAKSAPSMVFDKFELNAQLAAAGILVPPQIAASVIGAETAAEKLGLPLVVKRRVAEGGRGVQLAGSAAEIETVLSRWQTGRADAFFQKYIPGELVMYGALVGEAGPLLERCFRATTLQKAQGPSARIVISDDREAARAGREIAAFIGLRGLGEFDFIKDADGKLWHIDANARCWGSMMAANAHCADFVSAYERLVAGRRPEADRGQTTEADIGIQPHSVLSAAATGSFKTFAAEWRDFARFCRYGPGAAYAALIAVKAAAALALRATRSGRHRRAA